MSTNTIDEGRNRLHLVTIEEKVQPTAGKSVEWLKPRIDHCLGDISEHTETLRKLVIELWGGLEDMGRPRDKRAFTRRVSLRAGREVAYEILERLSLIDNHVEDASAACAAAGGE